MNKEVAMFVDQKPQNTIINAQINPHLHNAIFFGKLSHKIQTQTTNTNLIWENGSFDAFFIICSLHWVCWS